MTFRTNCSARAASWMIGVAACVLAVAAGLLFWGQRQYGELQDELVRLQGQAAILREEVGNLNQQIADHDNTVARLRQQLAHAEEDTERLNQQVAQLRQFKDEAQRDLDSAVNKNIKELEAEKERFNRMVMALRQILDEYDDITTGLGKQTQQSAVQKSKDVISAGAKAVKGVLGRGGGD